MAATIWKFPLQITDRQTVQMPYCALILSVGVQGERPCLWALVDPDEPVEERKILIFGTGHPVDMDGLGRFIGTIMLDGGFHVFEGGQS